MRLGSVLNSTSGMPLGGDIVPENVNHRSGSTNNPQCLVF